METMTSPWVYVLWACGAYLLGSVSFGDIVARLTRTPIREIGTGNPGAANVFREMGLKYAVLVFALDLAKGVAATLPVFLLGLPAWAGLAGAAGVLMGHLLPVFWGFRGGTGMVVAMGVAFGLLPAGALIATVPALVLLRFRKNAGYTGAVFFALALPVGWLVHQDLYSVGDRSRLAAAAVMGKSKVQYRWRSIGLQSGQDIDRNGGHG